MYVCIFILKKSVKRCRELGRNWSVKTCLLAAGIFFLHFTFFWISGECVCVCVCVSLRGVFVMMLTQFMPTH